VGSNLSLVPQKLMLQILRHEDAKRQSKEVWEQSREKQSREGNRERRQLQLIKQQRSISEAATAV
jgi:hypothetical protein